MSFCSSEKFCPWLLSNPGWELETESCPRSIPRWGDHTAPVAGTGSTMCLQRLFAKRSFVSVARIKSTKEWNSHSFCDPAPNTLCRILKSPAIYPGRIQCSASCLWNRASYIMNTPGAQNSFGTLDSCHIFKSDTTSTPYQFSLYISSRAFRNILRLQHRCKVQLLNQESWHYMNFHMSLLQMLVSIGYFWRVDF